ncbi:MAG: ABC transporter permease subunit [Pseudohongiellaceae bacterium]
MITPQSTRSGPELASPDGDRTTQLGSLLTANVFRRKLRYFIDQLARILIGAGGIGVIVAILMIFIYLMYEVLPLFKGAEVFQLNEYQLLQARDSGLLHLAVEEQSTIAMRLGDDGQAVFFNVADGQTVSSIQVEIPERTRITHFALNTEDSGLFALGLSDGRAVVARYQYETAYAQDGSRIITPEIEYPYGEQALPLFPGIGVHKVAIRSRGDTVLLAAVDTAGNTLLVRISQPRNLMSAFNPGGAQPSFQIEEIPLGERVLNVDQLFIDGDQRWLYFVTNTGRISLLDLRPALAGQQSRIEEEFLLVEPGRNPTDIAFLLGGISLLVADDSGKVSQWMLGTVDGRVLLQNVRSFESDGFPIIALAPEQRRKNFIAMDSSGQIGIYNTTAHREVFFDRLVEGRPTAMAIAPRGDTLVTESDNGNITVWDVHNEHPEVSWSALWGKVRYENYSEPEYIWQSSAASNDFEPKYSLMPLAFGTLKAAFYAMLLAMPLAICGAIFTGYFMVPVMRRKVKPLIELMAALPTVVLGFLAGLWLAPFVENNLLGIFSLMVMMPLGILLASFAWVQLPQHIRHRVPDGWEAMLLVPVVIIVTYVCFAFSTTIETLLFDGSIRTWITVDLGITYDQRNALIVGLAMGFAVIPTIFSIAEDAIFTVPKHLTYGSLALGATPWQTLYRVILPTASPGIFSASMIGFGRAVGETMIVLMATGNTPIMDINIFEGMRTLAANIAVEVPESEVDSTHYRILFLAALVLFLFTFIFNTMAEIIRQRLRDKYSTI